MDDTDSNPGSYFQAAPEAVFHFRQAFMRQWQDSVRYFGFWRTLRELAAACWRAALELLPSRREARFGDLDYDWEHEVDTTRSNVSFRAQLLAELAGRPYFASEPWLFEPMMQSLALSLQSGISQGAAAQARLQDFTFIDLGSGKGRALLMAAPFGFKRIIGVEFVPEWHRVAQKNIQKVAAANPSAPAVESLCKDARDFDFPNEPLVVYLFSPFPESTFVAILDRLRESLLQNQRPVLVAYRYPEFEQQLQKCGWLEKLAGCEQWAVYKNCRHRAGSLPSP